MQLGKLTDAESALLPDNDAMRVRGMQPRCLQLHCMWGGAPLVLRRAWSVVTACTPECFSRPALTQLSLSQPTLPAHAAHIQVPNGGVGFYLLGRIHQLSNRHSTAIAYYSTALQADPMLWSAFEELCALGADHEAQQFLALGGGVGGAAAAASSRLFSSYGVAPGTAPGAAADSAAAGVGSPSSSFPPVATPSVAAAQQCPGSPSGPAPLSTAATKTGLGAMFSWMDSGRHRGGDRGTVVRAGAGRDCCVAAHGCSTCSRQPRLLADVCTGCSALADIVRIAEAPAPTLLLAHHPKARDACSMQGMQGVEGGTPSPGSYVTPSPGGRLSAPPPPAPKAGGIGAVRPAWPATSSPAPLSITTGGGLALPSTGVPGLQRKFVDEGKMRKVSGKLFAEPASVLKQLRWHGGGEGSSSGSAVAAEGGGGGSLADMAALPGVPRGHRSPEGQAQALPLLQALGEGYRLLCMYRWALCAAGCWEGWWYCSVPAGVFLLQLKALGPLVLLCPSLHTAGARRLWTRSAG